MNGRGGKPFGVVTRGTTNPNRLRRVDDFIAYRCGDLLARSTDPLVVDLGYGATPVTAVELRDRLVRTVRPDIRVVGVEIDAARVAAAAPMADPPALSFLRGGFELAGLRPAVVRAFNVLRQYPPEEVAAAWGSMTRALGPGGLVVEGTCDERGRIGTWVCLDATGPLTLTLSARLSTLERPLFAPRLPKALIHHNVPGRRVHEFLRAVEGCWNAAAPYAPFGPRQRWLHTVAALHAAGLPVRDRPHRWRRGELTVPWSLVAPP